MAKKSKKAPKSHMKKHPGGTSTIKTSVRKRSATVVQHKKGADGGSTKYRFPMPDVAHARAALADLPKAKGLSASDKKKIRTRAERMISGGKSEKGTMISKKNKRA